jgi:hypothetical protein
MSEVSVAEPAAIKVAVADDQALVRSGFAALLDAEDDITVTGSAADGFAAVRLAQDTRPSRPPGRSSRRPGWPACTW